LKILNESNKFDCIKVYVIPEHFVYFYSYNNISGTMKIN